MLGLRAVEAGCCKAERQGYTRVTRLNATRESAARGVHMTQFREF